MELDPGGALTVEPGVQCRNPPPSCFGYHMYPEEPHFTGTYPVPDNGGGLWTITFSILPFPELQMAKLYVQIFTFDIAPFPVVLASCAAFPLLPLCCDDVGGLWTNTLVCPVLLLCCDVDPFDRNLRIGHLVVIR